MTIVVCLKQVEYVYAVSGDDPANNFITPYDKVRLNNPADEIALAQAVRLRREMGGEIWVFSLVENLLLDEAVRALALGADRFIRFWDDQWRYLDAWGVAQVLAAGVKRVSADLVLCGARSMDLMRGEVPAYLAHHLARPLVADVVELDGAKQSGLLRLKKNLGLGDRVLLEAGLPLVVSLDNAAASMPYPSHANRLKVRPEQISHWDGAELGIAEDAPLGFFTLAQESSPRPLPKTIDLLDGNLPAAERIKWLLAGKDDAKNFSVLEGPADELGESLVRYLAQGGFLKASPLPEEG